MLTIWAFKYNALFTQFLLNLALTTNSVLPALINYIIYRKEGLLLKAIF